MGVAPDEQPSRLQVNLIINNIHQSQRRSLARKYKCGMDSNMVLIMYVVLDSFHFSYANQMQSCAAKNVPHLQDALTKMCVIITRKNYKKDRTHKRQLCIW